MRKFKWIFILVLISCTVAFIACKQEQRRQETDLPDPKPPEMDKSEPPPPEIVTPTPEMPEEAPLHLVDVLIFTNRSFWITIENAEIAAEMTKKLLDAEGINVHITKNDVYVRDWMRLTTDDGNVNVIILYGVLPDSVYGTGNSQPNGSVAENWIETTDGDTILNHADYIAYNTDDDVNKITELGLDTSEGIGSNLEGGLQNLMDNPNISLLVPDVPDPRHPGSTIGGPVSMIVTSDGTELTPSLVNFESFRSIPLNQLQGEWFAEKVFASDTGNAQAAYADPVILRDGNLGRIAIVHATQFHLDLLNGEVTAEIIINYLLAE